MEDLFQRKDKQYATADDINAEYLDDTAAGATRRVRSSNAGASSAEFHIYRRERRREEERLARLEAAQRERALDAEYVQRRVSTLQKEQERTQKRAEKRRRAKEQQRQRSKDKAKRARPEEEEDEDTTPEEEEEDAQEAEEK